MSSQVHIEIHWIFNACIWTQSSKVWALLCFGPPKIKLHATAQRCGGRGHVILWTGVTMQQSDTAGHCRSTLVTWVQCLCVGQDGSDVCKNEPGWAVICRGERRKRMPHAHPFEIATWDKGAARHVPEDCLGWRADLDTAFSLWRETGWLLLWNFVAALYCLSVNISL